MTRPRFVIALAVAASLFGAFSAASADPYAVRLPDDAPQSQFVAVPDRRPDPHRATLVAATAIEGTSFAVSGAKGSVAAGVMFGPLGILANSAAVKNSNSERGAKLGALLQTDVNALLRQFTPNPAQTAANGAYYELSPLVVTKFTDATHFKLECYIFAYTPVGERWGRGNFSALGAGAFDAEQPESVAAAAEALKPCLQEVYTAFVAYVDRRGVFTESGRVRLDGVGPRTLDYLPTDDGKRFIFNNFNMVRSYRADAVEFVSAD